MFYKNDFMTRTKKKYKKIELNPFQIAALCKLFNRKPITINRWAEKNHMNLTHPIALDIIKKYENQPELK